MSLGDLRRVMSMTAFTDLIPVRTSGLAGAGMARAGMNGMAASLCRHIDVVVERCNRCGMDVCLEGAHAIRD
jgi:hypothetical protein